MVDEAPPTEGIIYNPEAMEQQERVKESLRPSKPGIWTVGDRLQLSLHTERGGAQYAWEDGHGSWYVLSEPGSLASEHHLLDEARELSPIYVAGPHAVWDLGTAFLKIIYPCSPLQTREHVTLKYMHQRKPSFAVPDVIYHGEWDGRYYLVVSRVPGQTLIKAWAGMSAEEQEKCVARVADICEELAAWPGGEKIQGVDGGDLTEYYISGSDPPDFSHEAMLKKCRELGMDVSNLMFYHCDMGPPNVLYDDNTGRLSVIDWECAGFVPKEWIRTKFRLSGGMDLEEAEGESRYDYRRRVAACLGDRGWGDVSERWVQIRRLET